MGSVMLFVPSGDSEKLVKLDRFSGIPLILDLEDAVAVTQKSAARERVRAIAKGWGQASELWVRSNAVSTQLWERDLEAVVEPGLRGVVIPKVESSEDIQRVDEELSRIEAERDIPAESIALIPLIESARGLAHADAIARSASRLYCLGFGAGDFSLDLGIDWLSSDGELSPTLVAAKAQLVIASRANRLRPPHDGAYPRFRDLAGLRREAVQAKQMGFAAKHAIHPSQIAVIQEAFRPSVHQLEWARKVLAAFEAQERLGTANVQVDGELVDYPVAERARGLLAAEGVSRQEDA